MENNECLGLITSLAQAALDYSHSQGQQSVRNSLHCRYHHGHRKAFCGRTHEASGVNHTARTEQRGASKFERHNFGERVRGKRSFNAARHGVAAWLSSGRETLRPAGVLRGARHTGGATFSYGFLLLYEFGIHDDRSLGSAGATLEGEKEETHRQVRFWRWVGNFF